MKLEELKGRRWKLQRYIAQGRAHKKHRPLGGGGIKLKNLMKRDRSLCHICGLGVARADASRDHVVPLSAGGSGAAPRFRSPST